MLKAISGWRDVERESTEEIAPCEHNSEACPGMAMLHYDPKYGYIVFHEYPMDAGSVLRLRGIRLVVNGILIYKSYMKANRTCRTPSFQSKFAHGAQPTMHR